MSVAAAEPTTTGEADWTVAGHRARRSERFALREAGRRVVLDQRVKCCGLLPTRSPDGGWTVLRAEVELEQVCQVVGPGLCGKVNLCGWCAGPIRQKRADEIDQALAGFLGAGRGGVVWLVTCTTSPVEGESMDDALARMTATYKAWSEGGARARWNSRYQLVASHRTLEVTVTPATLRAHWHQHTLLWLGDVTAESEALALVELRRLWIDAAEAHGASVHWRHGFDVVPVVLNEDGTTSGVGSYVAKSAGKEACRGDMKRSRVDSFAPLELITAFQETGDLIYRQAFQAYERAVAGVGPFRWSQNARRKIAAWIAGDTPDPAATDVASTDAADVEEVPAELVDGARPVAHIDAHAARWLASRRLFDAVHLVAEAAPSDDRVPDYLRELARSAGAPGFVLDGIGLPIDANR